MTNNDIFTGQRVLARDEGSREWYERIYIGSYDGGHYCLFEDDREVEKFDHVKPWEEPKDTLEAKVKALDFWHPGFEFLGFVGWSTHPLFQDLGFVMPTQEGFVCYVVEDGAGGLFSSSSPNVWTNHNGGLMRVPNKATKTRAKLLGVVVERGE